MSPIKLLICLASVIYVAESACTSVDSCLHYYGRRLLNPIQAQAQLIAYTKVQEQESSFDPIPCCLKCVEQIGCDYYFLEFINGNCTLFSLPNNDKFVMNLAAGAYFQKITYPNCCIGFTNMYIFSHMMMD